MEYICARCGGKHEEWPSPSMAAPDAYFFLTEEEKAAYSASLDEDFCEIRYPDQHDRFIRTVLAVPVTGGCRDLEYGVWVSLSGQNFNDYRTHFTDNPQAEYFGWLSNHLPDYGENTLGIPCTVVTRTDGMRPHVFPHRDYPHDLVRDFYDGIGLAEAERRINNLLKCWETMPV